MRSRKALSGPPLQSDESIRVQKEPEGTHGVCGSQPHHRSFLVGELVVKGFSFSLSLLPEAIHPCLGQDRKEKDCFGSGTQLHLPSCPMPYHAYLASPGHYLIPASNLQIFKGDTSPDSPSVSLPHPLCVQRREAGTGKASSLSTSSHTPNQHSPVLPPPQTLQLFWMCQKTLGTSGSSLLSGRQSLCSPWWLHLLTALSPVQRGPGESP